MLFEVDLSPSKTTQAKEFCEVQAAEVWRTDGRENSHLERSENNPNPPEGVKSEVNK